MGTPNSFDEAVQGADAVIHVASPVSLDVPRGQSKRAILIDPAIQGVENVLASVNKSPSVKTVVYTSSCASIWGDNWERGPDHVYTEADWDESASESYLPYNYGKTLAEKRAWQLYNEQQLETGDQKRWRLVTIHPGFVLGPPLSASVQSEGITVFADLLKGKYYPMLPNAQFPLVHLDDVAQAHVHAMLNASAQGRYMLVEGNRTRAFYDDMVKLLRDEFPGYKLPFTTAPKWILWLVATITRLYPFDIIDSTLNKPIHVDGSKATRELGIEYKDPIQGMKDTCRKVIELGMVPKK